MIKRARTITPPVNVVPANYKSGMVFVVLLNILGECKQLECPYQRELLGFC